MVKDANGQILSDGDSVVLIKDLKIKGIRQVGVDHGRAGPRDSRRGA
ncbi:PhnA domain-containing protein [Allochromatium palmeri]